jgi:hypothetical protein
MNQQDELGARISRLLDEGAEGLAPESRERLAAARRQALARHQEVTTRAPAWMPEWAGSLSRFTEQSVLGVRYVIPFAALVLGLMGVVYMHSGTVSSEIADIDAGLLTDDLPINAYLDQGFDSWLKRSSR